MLPTINPPSVDSAATVVRSAALRSAVLGFFVQEEDREGGGRKERVTYYICLQNRDH